MVLCGQSFAEPTLERLRATIRQEPTLSRRALSRRVRELQELSAAAVTPSNLLIVQARPTRNGDGIFLHLRELEGKPVTITQEEVRTATGIAGADEVNVLEEAVQPGIASLTFKPYEVKFLKLMFR